MSSSSEDSNDFYTYCGVTTSSKGKRLATNGGFTYMVDKKNAQTKTIYWKCILSRQGCKARLITVTCREEPPKYRIQRTTQGTPHNHEQSPTGKQRRDALTGLKRKAQDTRDRPANTILETNRQLSVEAGVSMPSQDALRRQIKRARRVATEREPHSIDEIEIPDRLTQTVSGEAFILANKRFEDDDCIMIFASLDSMIKLCRSEMIVMDGTSRPAHYCSGKYTLCMVWSGWVTTGSASRWYSH